MKKAILMMLCLLVMLLLSACSIHIDADPWPASPDYIESEASTSPAGTAAPAATAEPQTSQINQQSGEDIAPAATPTLPPSDEPVEPGFNG